MTPDRFRTPRAVPPSTMPVPFDELLTTRPVHQLVPRLRADVANLASVQESFPLAAKLLLPRLVPDLGAPSWLALESSSGSMRFAAFSSALEPSSEPSSAGPVGPI